MISNSLLVPLFTFVTGLIIGIIVEYLRFKHTIQIERIKTLSPILCEVYPITEKIVGDTNYALNLRQRNDKNEFMSFIETLFRDLEEYRMWDEKYREAGLKLILRHFSKGLNESFDAMRIYAISTNLQGKNHISGILEEMHKTSKKCLDEIKSVNIV
jgi:hypothetical protein